MFDVHDCVSFISNRGSKLIGDALNGYFPPDTITKVQWTALYHIERNEGLSQRELAKLMLIKEPTALHLVDRLEREGWVVRKTDPENRRVRHLQLTEEGYRVYSENLPRVIQFNEDAKRGISEEEIDTFKSVLDRMIENLTMEDVRGHDPK